MPDFCCPQEQACYFKGPQQASVVQAPSGTWIKPLVAWEMSMGISMEGLTEDTNNGEKK